MNCANSILMNNVRMRTLLPSRTLMQRKMLRQVDEECSKLTIYTHRWP